MIGKTNKKLLALALSLGISLTGCNSLQKDDKDIYSSVLQEPEEYNIQQYYLIFINGSIHLAYAQASKEDNYKVLEDGYGISEFIDVNTQECIAKIDPAYELDENAIFTNDYGDYTSRFAIILCQDLIEQSIVDQETFKFLASDNKKLHEYIKNNYLYNVVEYTDYQNKTWADDLGIYTFYYKDEKDYHLGYNANRINNCDYIYDIEDNKIYKKPILGDYSFVPLSAYYTYDVITANDAIQIKEDYIKFEKINSEYKSGPKKLVK